MVKKRTQPNAIERLKMRIQDRIDADRHRPAGLRRTQAGLAEYIGVTKATLNEWLNGESATRGALPRLDKIAEYFDIPPTVLIAKQDNVLLEIQPSEFRLLAFWRRFPLSVQTRILEMFDFFAGLPPEEQEGRRLWHRFQLIRNSDVRKAIDKSIDDALREQRSGRATDTAPVVQPSSGETASATQIRGDARRNT